VVPEIERDLAALFIAAEGASLRDEDRKKARELAGLLHEIAWAVDRLRHDRDITLVDAAAGKAYVALLAQRRVLAPRGRAGSIRAIERDPTRIASMLDAARRAGIELDAIEGDVGDLACWPREPDLVVALHACGDASDRVIASATEVGARFVLIAPCCVARSLPAAMRAAAHADAIGMPRSGILRRGMIESWVMGERALELESRGWRTEIVPFAGATVTPHHLLLRAERILEPGRMRASRARLARLRGEREPAGGG
jgi:hypothetical protein